MADKLIVSPGCSVRYPTGKVAKDSGRPVLTQGTEIPSGLFTPAQIEEHVKSKFMQYVARSDQPDPAALPKSIPDRPGETVAPAINAGDPGPSGKGSDPVTILDQPTGVAAAGGIPDVADQGAGVTLAPATLSVEPPPVATPAAPLSLVPPVEQEVPGPETDNAGSQVGPWIFDPATLQDKPLEELNVLIRARDESIELFDTVQEAIAWLSQNYITAE